MTFREKIHWVALFGLVAAFGWYFMVYPWGIANTRAGVIVAAWMLLPVTIIFLVPMIVGTAWFAIQTPKEANMKEDEREKFIHLRGTNVAYYLLVLGIWANVFVLINGIGFGWSLNILMATLVLAEIVRVGSQLYFYRRNA